MIVIMIIISPHLLHLLAQFGTQDGRLILFFFLIRIYIKTKISDESRAIYMYFVCIWYWLISLKCYQYIYWVIQMEISIKLVFMNYQYNMK